MGVSPSDVAALPQTSVDVLPTRTIYTFANAQIHVTLTFMTPALPSDLDLLSRPVTYVAWDVASADDRSHTVQLSARPVGVLHLHDHVEGQTGLSVSACEQQVDVSVAA